MKRILKTYLPKGWQRWNMFGDYGIIDSVNDQYQQSKQEAQWYWPEEEVKKIKITIEEV